MNNIQTWTSYKNALLAKAKEQGRLIFSLFELTPLCNFNCSMCYVHMPADRQKQIHPLIPAQQWIAYAEELKKAGVLFLTISGGEPLTFPEFELIYRTLYDMGFMINIMSNGYLMENRIIRMFCERKPASIKITLYGFSDETYRKVCGVDHAFDRVKENILKLKQCDLPVFVTTTVIQENAQDVPMIQEWANSNSIYYQASSQIKKTTRGVENRAGEVRLMPDSRYSQIEQGITQADPTPFVQNPFCHCRLHQCGFNITWDGKMIGCNSLANIYEEAIPGKLLENFKVLWDRMDRIKLPAKCAKCKLIEFCNPCPGKIAGESGDPETVSEYTCAIARQAAERYLSSHGQQEALCDND